jgi:hypothetical protein
LTTTATGELLVGGDFSRVGGNVAMSIARLASTCPAMVATSGAGCAGAAGIANLTVSSLPWTGAVCRTRVTSLPTSAVVAVVDGFSTLSLPLQSVLPQALPGCTLHVAPDVVGIDYSATGSVDHAFVVPDTAALAGFTLYEQAVVLALGPLGQFGPITTSNALQLTVGVF